MRVAQTSDVQLHIGESRDSGFASATRPGMTAILVRRFLLAAGDGALLLDGAPDARLDEAIQNLNNDAALLFDDGRKRRAANRRRDLLKRKDRHCDSPRR